MILKKEGNAQQKGILGFLGFMGFGRMVYYLLDGYGTVFELGPVASASLSNCKCPSECPFFLPFLLPFVTV